MSHNDVAGICRFCGCSEREACVVDDSLEIRGCHWIHRTLTVCSACAPAAKAETAALAAYPAARGIPAQSVLERAYHQGFVVGWFSVRGRFARNPFGGKPEQAYSWTRGQRDGAEASRVYQRACGPLPNAPRREVLVARRR